MREIRDPDQANNLLDGLYAKTTSWIIHVQLEVGSTPHHDELERWQSQGYPPDYLYGFLHDRSYAGFLNAMRNLADPGTRGFPIPVVRIFVIDDDIAAPGPRKNLTPDDELDNRIQRDPALMLMHEAFRLMSGPLGGEYVFMVARSDLEKANVKVPKREGVVIDGRDFIEPIFEDNSLAGRKFHTNEDSVVLDVQTRESVKLLGFLIKQGNRFLLSNVSPSPEVEALFRRSAVSKSDQERLNELKAFHTKLTRELDPILGESSRRV